MAFKFAAEETTSTVEEVTWEVGRTGKLTPLAHLDPVELAGATIQRATLNNFDDIQRKRVKIGSKVFIRRSNDVIPEILGAVPDDTATQVIEKPTGCPVSRRACRRERRTPVLHKLALLPRADHTSLGALCLTRCDGHRKLQRQDGGTAHRGSRDRFDSRAVRADQRAACRTGSLWREKAE
ncbi:MAG: hypothetical protein R2912_07350 [Eubacteriales bacterium]